MRIILFTFLLVSFISCSQVSLIDIKSTPDKAKVFARSLGTSERVEIGTTPFQIKSEEIQKKLNTSGLIIIEIERDQYFKEEFYLSEYSNNNIEISYNLRKSPKIDQAHNAK